MNKMPILQSKPIIQATGHCIMFTQPNFCGDHMHVFESTQNVCSAFNDKTQSIAILEGNWMFFVNANFDIGLKGPVNVEDFPPAAALCVAPGYYSNLDFLNTPSLPPANKCISSLMLVNNPVGQVQIPQNVTIINPTRESACQKPKK